MTQEQAEALVTGQKIKYWDGRIAEITSTAAEPTAGEVYIVFDADVNLNPKPVYQIKSNDFMRAEPL